MIRRYIFGLIGIALSAFCIYFGEAEPPGQLFLLGLFVGAIAVFYLIIVGVLHFAGFLFKELGYGNDAKE